MNIGRKKNATNQTLKNKIQLNMDIQEGEFALRERKRSFLGSEQRVVAALTLLLLTTLIVSFLFLVVVTNNNFSLAWVIQNMVRRINEITDLATGNKLKSGIQFFLCMFISPILAGSALSAAGACYQGIFHNPMASPTLLGVQSGGSLGGAVYVLLIAPLIVNQSAEIGSVTYGDYAEAYYSMSIFEHNIKQICVFLGCLLIVSIVIIISKTSNHGRLNTVSLMLGGTVFTTMITNVLNLIEYYISVTGGSTELMADIQSLNSGRFAPVSVPNVLVCMTIPIIICLVICIIMSDKLNIIVFGEEEAKTMGINTERYRLIFILLSTVLTATTVAFCGTISFIGLIVPQFARIIVGPNFKYLIPASAILGGLFLLLAFDFTYMIDFKLNIGTIVNSVGGIIFLITMIRYRRKGNADWT